jgi:hypothetical protein
MLTTDMCEECFVDKVTSSTFDQAEGARGFSEAELLDKQQFTNAAQPAYQTQSNARFTIFS